MEEDRRSSSLPTDIPGVVDMSPLEQAELATPSFTAVAEDDSAFTSRLDKGAPVMLVWSPGEDGLRCLTLVQPGDPATLPCKPPLALITALSRNTLV